MPGELIPIIIVPAFFAVIFLITKTLSDNRVKRELINMRADKETIDYLTLQSPSDSGESSLKWGIVAAALGAGLALVQVLGLSGEEPLTYGLMFIFGGGGLLAHYALKGISAADGPA
jgi:hypothetical protein